MPSFLVSSLAKATQIWQKELLAVATATLHLGCLFGSIEPPKNASHFGKLGTEAPVLTSTLHLVFSKMSQRMDMQVLGEHEPFCKALSRGQSVRGSIRRSSKAAFDDFARAAVLLSRG